MLSKILNVYEQNSGESKKSIYHQLSYLKEYARKKSITSQDLNEVKLNDALNVHCCK